LASFLDLQRLGAPGASGYPEPASVRGAYRASPQTVVLADLRSHGIDTLRRKCG